MQHKLNYTTSPVKLHDYYPLFPPVIPLAKVESVTLRDALPFVYIAQNVRPDGRDRCGVLTWDIPYRSEADHLSVLGQVEERRWR